MNKLRHLRPEDLRGKRWAGWLRESSADQAENVVRQQADIERAARELGMTGPVRWYSRVGSGEAVAMPELAAALADGARGEYDVLVAFHTSRFARNRAEATRMKREFQRAGIVVYFAAQRLISGSFGSVLTEGVSEVIDEYDNEVRRMWIAGGLRERAKAGRWTGHIPFGYRARLEDRPDGSRGWEGMLEVDPAELPTFRRIVDEYLAGRGGREIALRLNAAGVTNRGGTWHQTTVQRMVGNPAYLGELHRYRLARSDHYYDADDPDGRMVIAGLWPPLVTPEEHAALAAPRIGPRARRSPAFAYPLAGILRCTCGRNFSGVHNGSVRYYRCGGRMMGTGCTAPHIRSEVAEGSFADWLDRLALPADWREAIARSRLTPARSEEETRRKRLEATLERMRNLYVWGELAEDRYRSETAQVKAELSLVTLPNVGSMESVASLLEEVGQVWRSVPVAVQSLLPRALLAYGEVKGGAVAWMARAELRPLLDLCVVTAPDPYAECDDYTLEYAV